MQSVKVIRGLDVSIKNQSSLKSRQKEPLYKQGLSSRDNLFGNQYQSGGQREPCWWEREDE